jgi:hypothetical protein
LYDTALIFRFPQITAPDNENVFIPFETYRDIMDVRDPGMIVFAPLTPELHRKALQAVRDVLARRHHFDPKDEPRRWCSPPRS